MAVSPPRPDPASPAAVAGASFGVSRKGYDPDEVRSFLRDVAAVMTRLQQQVESLERDLAAARSTAAAPAQLDEDTVTALLGEETARIVQTAREAAHQIRARAEESAAKMLRDASEDAARQRSEIEIEVARRRADANSDAVAEIEMARQQGRDMVNEARDYRERVLSDVARRRELARAQLEQLVHGRDRLLNAFERARLAAVDVMAELAPLGEEPDELVNLAPTTGPVALVPNVRDADPAPAESAPSRPAGDDGRPTDEVPVVAGSPAMYDVDDEDLDDEDLDDDDSDDETTAVAVEIDVEEGADGFEIDEVGTDPVDAADVEDAGDAEDHDGDDHDGDDHDDDVEESVDAADDHLDIDDQVDGAHDADDDTDDTAELHDDPAHEGAELLVLSDHRHERERDEYDDADHDDDHDDDHEDEDDERPPATVVSLFAGETDTERSRPEPVATETAAPEAVATETAATETAATEPDDAPSSKPTVDDLFAKLRRASAAMVAKEAAEALAAGEHAAPVGGDPVADGADEAIGDTSDVTASGVFAERDEALVPLIVSSARKLKRVLADEQNDVLDALRRANRIDTVDALLPAETDQVARYTSAVDDDLRSAAEAGARSIREDADVAQVLGSASLLAPVAESFALDVVRPLRERLDRAVMQVGEDPAELASLVRNLYREWKTQRIDEHVEDLVRLAHGRGAYVALAPGMPVCWSVDPNGPPCADAEDNALAGAVPAGDAFPTGHTHPPMHSGCRCVLVRDHG